MLVLPKKRHSLDYALTLYDSRDQHLVGFHKIHPVAKQTLGDPYDHRHRLRAIRPHDDWDATPLPSAFRATVDAVLREKGASMTTLKIGIASYEAMKARTMAVARGERRIAPEEPKVWFTASESVAKVRSAGNRDRLRVIAAQAPGSLDVSTRITGKANQPLSRTLRTRKDDRLVRPQRGERGRITPTVTHDRVELDLKLT